MTEYALDRCDCIEWVALEPLACRARVTEEPVHGLFHVIGALLRGPMSRDAANRERPDKRWPVAECPLHVCNPANKYLGPRCSAPGVSLGKP
jgi:hypothetical protein